MVYRPPHRRIRPPASVRPPARALVRDSPSRTPSPAAFPVPPPASMTPPLTFTSPSPPATPPFMEQEHYLAPSLRDAIIRDPLIFTRLPDDEKTEELCDLFLALCPGNLFHIPKEKQTLKHVLKTIIHNPGLIVIVEPRFLRRNAPVILQYLNRPVLEVVTSDAITPLLAELALKQSPEAFSLLPEKLQYDYKLFNLAVNLGFRAFHTLQENVFLHHVKRWPEILYVYPETELTESRCVDLVRETPSLLAFLPDHMKTYRVCLFAWLAALLDGFYPPTSSLE